MITLMELISIVNNLKQRTRSVAIVVVKLLLYKITVNRKAKINLNHKLFIKYQSSQCTLDQKGKICNNNTNQPNKFNLAKTYKAKLALKQKIGEL